MSHAIEPGDVVYSDPSGLHVVKSVDGNKITTGLHIDADIADFTLIAKGLENLPKTIDEAIEIAEDTQRDMRTMPSLWNQSEDNGATVIVKAIKAATRKETA